ncbi:MAG: helix-turn-helix domain-containing protein [Myxococcales bacterium]
MDTPLAAAARALSEGDPLRALKHVALRDDAQAVAMRATALAQLGEYREARELFKRAAKGFSQNHAIARARCVVALAEVALAMRELSVADAGLGRAIEVLERHGDAANARYAQLLHARYALALGHVGLAQERLAAIEVPSTAHVLRALTELTQTEVAVRRMQPAVARKALAAAGQAALRAQVPTLIAEVRTAKLTLERPVARLVDAGNSEPLALDQVAELLQGPQLVIDACRRCVRRGDLRVSYATRPVLFALVRQLAEASPREVSREALIRAAFGIQRPNDSLRARLRVAVGRVRKQLAEVASLEATPSGFALLPRQSSLCVLLPPSDDATSSLLALVSDGEAWSTSALALALGASQRSVQRALGALRESGKVESVGHGKNRRWLAQPIHPFATHMLLPLASPRS